MSAFIPADRTGTMSRNGSFLYEFVRSSVLSQGLWPNYIELPQPFYVLAGWLVPDDRIVDVNVAIDGFRKAHFRQRDELTAIAVLQR